MSSARSADSRTRRNAKARVSMERLLVGGDTASVYGQTFNEDTALWENSEDALYTEVPIWVAEIGAVKDPDINSVIQSLNISPATYREITMPVRYTVDASNRIKRIVKEPVTDASPVYQVKQAADDATGRWLAKLHCQKAGD